MARVGLVAPPKGKPAILVYDLEVSPALGYYYPPQWKTSILWEVHGQYLMSFAYRWYGSKKTHYLDLRDFSSYKRDRKDDKGLTKALFDLWQQADIVVAFNGDRFDNPMSRTFFMRHNLVPTPVRSIDPMKIAKKEFRLSSNSMKNVAKELGVAPKMEVPLGNLTKAIIEHDDKDAWKQFKEYNVQDVDTLIEIWEKIKGYATTHLNMATYSDEYDSCTRCGVSEWICQNGFAYTNSYTYQRFRCDNRGSKRGCGASFRTRVSEQAKASDVKTRYV